MVMLGTPTKKGAPPFGGAPFFQFSNSYSLSMTDMSTGGSPMSCSDSMGMIFDGASGRGG